MKLDSRILNINQNVKSLSDKALLEQTSYLNEHDRSVTILILRHLREIEVRRLFVDLGFTSMHMYCIKHLKNSESQAQRRISSARLLTELPEIEKDIEVGNLNLTNLSKIQTFVRAEKTAQHALSKDEKLNIIEQCKNKSTREVERELIEKSHQPSLLAEKFHLNPAQPNSLQHNTSDENPEVQYLKFEALLAPEHQELLQEFRNLYAHELKDNANISALAFLLEKAVNFKKKKLGLIPKETSAAKAGLKIDAESDTRASNDESKRHVNDIESANTVSDNYNATPPSSPKVVQDQVLKVERDQQALENSKPQPQRKAIKISLQRAVWQRAQACCEHLDSETKMKCGSQYALEIDHIHPLALGGDDEFENLRLLCRAHNSRRSVQSYGQGWH